MFHPKDHRLLENYLFIGSLQMHTTEDIKKIYEKRRNLRQGKVVSLDKKSGRIANLRLLVFMTTVAIGIAAYLVSWFSFAWLIMPVIGFLALMIWHEVVIRIKRKALRAIDFYEKGLSRLNNTWQGNGIGRVDFVPVDHPFASDLDLFGPGSLFELLCTARTWAGEHMLAKWLLSPGLLKSIRKRQKAVMQLRESLDLREQIALLAEDIQGSIHPETLEKWGKREPVFSLKGVLAWRIFSFLLGGAGIGSLFIWGATNLGPIPLILVVLIEWGVYRRMNERISEVIAKVELPKRELLLMAGLLEKLENIPAQCQMLEDLKKELLSSGFSASEKIRKLDRLVAWLDAQRNQLFMPIAFLVLWSLHFALAIESWRLKSGKDIARWFNTVGRFEALCALAGYAFENPEDPFAEFHEDGDTIQGESLGHPLLPQETCIRNSISLGGECRFWVVSGSNMSGKSTFLRVVGINVVLAMAGAPVRAKGFRLCPLSIGATIRIQDSLAEGSSRFYAEIKRISQLMDLTLDERPLLFLLDEILHGTNSHDRKIGAEAIVTGLVEKGAIGLVTTHDLALAKVADSLENRAKNVHFDDRIENGKLIFDYALKQGVVKKSNALELMRSVGLDV